MIAVAGFGTATNITDYGGWTSLNETDCGTATIAAAYIWTDGSEGADSTWTTDGSVKSAHRVWLISDMSLDTAPELANGGCGGATLPNPPNLAPSWGSADTLWIATDVRDAGSPNYSDWPDNYIATGEVSSGSSTGDCSLGYCHRFLTAASEDPTTFTWSSFQDGLEYTIAVRPGPPQNQQVSQDILWWRT